MFDVVLDDPWTHVVTTSPWCYCFESLPSVGLVSEMCDEHYYEGSQVTFLMRAPLFSADTVPLILGQRLSMTNRES